MYSPLSDSPEWRTIPASEDFQGTSNSRGLPCQHPLLFVVLYCRSGMSERPEYLEQSLATLDAPLEEAASSNSTAECVRARATLIIHAKYRRLTLHYAGFDSRAVLTRNVIRGIVSGYLAHEACNFTARLTPSPLGTVTAASVATCSLFDGPVGGPRHLIFHGRMKPLRDGGHLQLE